MIIQSPPMQAMEQKLREEQEAAKRDLELAEAAEKPRLQEQV